MIEPFVKSTGKTPDLALYKAWLKISQKGMAEWLTGLFDGFLRDARTGRLGVGGITSKVSFWLLCTF